MTIFYSSDVKVQTADDHVSTNVLGEEVLELVGDTASVSESGGIKASVNGKEVALFVWKKELYCVDAHCPHMGEQQRTSHTLIILSVFSYKD